MTARHARTVVLATILVALAPSVLVHAQATSADIAESRARAEQGDALWQFLLGYVYDIGNGVPQDDAEAVRWYRLAAEQGDASGQTSLGFAYRFGEGVPQDDAESVRWYRLAAEQKNASAQFYLGIWYDLGRGVPQDVAEAVRWFRLAAEQGHARAMYNLGGMYEAGRGVPQDYVQAHMWYNLAASKRSGEDRQRSIRSREATESLMTPAQLAEAQRLAREWDAAHPREPY